MLFQDFAQKRSCAPTLLLLCCLCSGVAAESGIVNTNVKRLIDLTSHVARQVATVSFTNSGSREVNTYVIALPKKHADRLASMMVFDSSEKELKVDAGVCDGDKVLYSVEIANLKQGAETRIRMSLAFSRILEPLPVQIAQNEHQLVRYSDNHYFFSPYKTINQRAEVRLYSQMIESYSEVPPTHSKGDVIEYGPYSNIPPFHLSRMLLHFENNSPFATATTSSKSIVISNRGTVTFKESVELEHAGAKLKGFFSRLDYQKNPHTHGAAAIKSLIASLPPKATDIYFRDEIGNISTAFIRRSASFPSSAGGADMTILDLVPRYPLFGGWRTDFHYGYSLPVAAAAAPAGATGGGGAEEGGADVFVLHFNFGLSLEGVHCDNHSVRLVLPEGAADVEVGLPFGAEGQESGWHWGFLDTIGRPVVMLWKTNVVDEHRRAFQVRYRLSGFWVWREPILCVLIVCGLSSLYLLHSRIAAAADPVQDRVRRFRAAHDRRAAARAAAARAWRAFCRGGDREALRVAKQQCKERLDACRAETEVLISDLDRLAAAGGIAPPSAASSGGAAPPPSGTASSQAAAGAHAHAAGGLWVDAEMAAAAAAAAALMRQANRLEAELSDLRAAAYAVDAAGGGGGVGPAGSADSERGAAKMGEVETAIQRLVDKL